MISIIYVSTYRRINKLTDSNKSYQFSFWYDKTWVDFRFETHDVRFVLNFFSFDFDVEDLDKIDQIDESELDSFRLDQSKD